MNLAEIDEFPLDGIAINDEEEQLLNIVEGAEITFNALEPHESKPCEHVELVEGSCGVSREDAWAFARKMFPRISFPWEVLPDKITQSLKQLARSCASSDAALPGVAISIIASVLGSTIGVRAKESWDEPLIFWVADIRPSGAGKTPAARSLCKLLYDLQKVADKKDSSVTDEWKNDAHDENATKPDRPRGYFITDLTLEGLRDEIRGHGGIVAILDEVSYMITSQNQYKGKGSDRETWLCLHDGHPARIVRAGTGKTITIPNSRFSVFGGIQPAVWGRAFTSSDGIFLQDGTAFRFLVTYETGQFHVLTPESWSEENRKTWENLLFAAMQWADKIVASPNWDTKYLCLDENAQTVFIDWRNDLYAELEKLPKIVQGVIPKAVGYALRLAGVLHCIWQFAEGKEPSETLTVNDIERGIKAALFYLGQMVDAAFTLISYDHIEVSPEITSHIKHLAMTLNSLRGSIDNGHLAIGFIYNKYMESCSKEAMVGSPKAIGSMVRSVGLIIPEKRRRANGRNGAFCLRWDDKTEHFINTHCNLQQVQQVHKASNDEAGEVLKVIDSASTSSTKIQGNGNKISPPEVVLDPIITPDEAFTPSPEENNEVVHPAALNEPTLDEHDDEVIL
jgi:hypothetical protein